MPSIPMLDEKINTGKNFIDDLNKLAEKEGMSQQMSQIIEDSLFYRTQMNKKVKVCRVEYEKLLKIIKKIENSNSL